MILGWGAVDGGIVGTGFRAVESSPVGRCAGGRGPARTSDGDERSLAGSQLGACPLQ